MFVREVRLYRSITGQEYTLLPRDQRPFFPGEYRAVGHRPASSMLVAVIHERPDCPQWDLLHALGITEHPHNLDLHDLEVMVDNGLSRGLGLQLLQRLPRAPSALATTKRITIEARAPATSQDLSYLHVELVDEDNTPIQGLLFEVTMPDSSVRTMITDAAGQLRALEIPAGSCVLQVPSTGRA